jgi:Cu(I)/Ag(I) efflux system membrane protein CusA/SilA
LESRSTGPTLSSDGLGKRIEARAAEDPGTRSAFAERVGGGYFLDFEWKRDQLARYGLSVDDAQDVVTSAIGGENVSTTIEGRERYPINVRYTAITAGATDKPGRVLVPAMDGKCRSRLQSSPRPCGDRPGDAAQ